MIKINLMRNKRGRDFKHYGFYRKKRVHKKFTC
ncbi:hypothetical protein CLLI_26600 [Clostridium liquoris]|uniref:Uncharacterized protein n=1 Tax=Clostridium liquoris TaxID=1289519 RepID=A0A2T0B0E1_9CLOT|nr:hypothetical protein CLLI_26600 [Clostridium liquoris]